MILISAGPLRRFLLLEVMYSQFLRRRRSMNGYEILFREDRELGSTESSFISTYLIGFNIGWMIWTSLEDSEAVM